MVAFDVVTDEVDEIIALGNVFPSGPSDADAAETLTYSITGGNTLGAFAINSATGEITVDVGGFKVPAYRAAPAGKTNLPVVLVGRGGGLQPGRHIVYPETPMTNLYLSMLDKMGVRTEKLGDSTGETNHLTGV